MKNIVPLNVAKKVRFRGTIFLKFHAGIVNLRYEYIKHNRTKRRDSAT